MEKDDKMKNLMQRIMQLIGRLFSNTNKEKPQVDPFGNSEATSEKSGHQSEHSQKVIDASAAIIYDYDLENIEPSKVKQFFALGKTAQDGYETLKQSQKNNAFQFSLFSDNETAERWFKKLPNIFNQFNRFVAETKTERARLNGKLKALETDKEAYELKQQEILSSLDAELEKSKNQIDRLSKEKDDFQEVVNALQAKLKSAQSESAKKQDDINNLQSDLAAKTISLGQKRQEIVDLQEQKNVLQAKSEKLQTDFALKTKLVEQKHQEVVSLQKHGENLQREINTLQLDGAVKTKELAQKQQAIFSLEAKLKEREEEIVSLKKKGVEREMKLLELEWVLKLSVYLQKGERYYLDEKNDSATAATLSFLLTFSLSKLHEAIVRDESIRRNAMLVNLYSISRKLEKTLGFRGAAEELEKHVTNINVLEKSLTCTEERHYEDKMFQMFLRNLRNFGRLDLGPFYFDINGDGKVHFAN